jgi:ABC-type transporter Mla maintaining outer membrane lipid asymmetry ATPase subunit MlaF
MKRETVDLQDKALNDFGTRTILDNVSGSVEAGRVMAIINAS